ncbi:MAG TPA: hypothetical protein PKO06_07925, partial [Candidatus Ozemobacteraceae bacterium]|nr:hypothetical protein [Candidatus Ozemobacteraceae bacterium]
MNPTPEALNLNKKKDQSDTSVNSDSADSLSDKIKGKLAGLIPGMPEINVLPPTSYGISLLGVAMHLHPLMDPWAKWEWPFMGMGWRLFRIPNTGVGQNVTHLFGSGGIFPPMTRSIEGFVLKRYRQWNLGIVGWPMGPYPLVGNQITIPFTPPILLPPIPIPLWHTHDIVNKYDYNLWLLKAPKDKDGSEGDEDVVTYDPGIQENSPPNLYSIEQYAKKATYYYTSQADFYKDLPNRLIKVGDSQALRLNGITFIADSLVIPPVGSGTLKVTGKGAIVVGGNIILTGNIEDAYTPEQERSKETPRTIFSLIARQGGLIFDSNASANHAKIEGCVYTD